MAQANAELGTDLPLSAIAPTAPAFSEEFRGNFHGLKKAIYVAAAQHTCNNSTINLAEKMAESRDISKVALMKRASVDLIDATGRLRPLEAIEAEALTHAYHHLEGRVGKIAKALKLSRTTLYRKLIKQKLARPDERHRDEQGSDIRVAKSGTPSARAA